MPQITSHTQVREFLALTPPFDRLSGESQDVFASKCQLLRYRMGQNILVYDLAPTQVLIIYQGQVRMLGYTAPGTLPISLGTLGVGGILGWSGLTRGLPCETAIASSETIVVSIAAADFLEIVQREPELKRAFYDTCSLSEIFELMAGELRRRADAGTDPKDLAVRIQQEAKVLSLPEGTLLTQQLDPNLVWLVSAGAIAGCPVGSRLDLSQSSYTVESRQGVRLVGFRDFGNLAVESQPEVIAASTDAVADIPYAPKLMAPPPPETASQESRRYPYFRGRGPVDGLIACLQMLGKYLDTPFKKDVVQRAIENQLRNTGKISLQLCGAMVEMVGMSAQLVQVRATALARLKAPAMIQWQDSFAIVYSFSATEIVYASPESGGIQRKKLEQFLQSLDADTLQVLMVRQKLGEREEKFGLHTFLPYLKEHSRVLIEVLIASFFILMFSLGNPIIIQIIIDKVLVQNSIDTLDILGILLIAVALFESLLTALRTYLFVDTTNRIDMKLGTEIIDHLLRLPLGYFDQRRVGELSTRIGELERLRQFMTGTALTVVLDAVFSVVYIVVMLFYSWLLTFWALVTVPFFILLAAIASPLIRRQLRTRAERQADTQSYLVEVLTGVQTVKAQNIELKSRWQWQEKYARYVNAGFKTVLTSSWAGAFSTFLNHLSGLLLIWVGAHLVLKNELTLGQLIAFRIIAGYVTSPLLRLAQLWQSFQEVGLSIERLSDIMDAKQEVAAIDRNNIPMPEIDGAIKYEELTFRFPNSPYPQLANINLEIPAGCFVGIVGQSGSGKSTLTKLLQRLYAPQSGRIQIDNYDIAKVELYSLRRQIGTVLQDTLLFNTTVQENIALSNPDATQEEIIEAARIAAAHEFIMTLPQGYNTVVGERGAGLSGGQRQRIAIARTVLSRPRLLILDEATSALDYDSERQVCNNLAESFRDRTVLFITHRLNTIKNADIILMMDQGAIVEKGTHDELMQMKGRYFCLFQQQDAQS